MKKHKYEVKLTDDEAKILQDIFKKGKHPAAKVKRANILWELDRLNYQPIPHRLSPMKIIAGRCGVNTATVYAVSKRFAEEGFESSLERKKRKTPPVPPKVTGDIEARIIALACSEPPTGYCRWTLRLLESQVVELGIIDSISDSTICRLLKKTSLSLI